MADLPGWYIPLNYCALAIHLIYFAISIFLIAAVHSTQLHLNCKFLLSLWGVSYMTQFASHAAIFVLNTMMTSLPLNKQDPRIRGYLITVSAGTQAFSETLEIMIASERILSSINPAKYHISGLNLKMLIPYTLVAFSAAFFQSWMAQESLHLIIAIVICALEICSLIMNAVAVKYCGRRFDELFGNSSLNARYQVKEARELAVSMQRAYLVTFVAKNLVNSVIVVGCIRVNEERNCIPLLYPLSFTALEAIYYVGFTTTSAFLLMSLLYNHPRLRMKTRILLAKIRGSSKVHDVFEAPKIESTGTVYFDDLRRAWN